MSLQEQTVSNSVSLPAFPNIKQTLGLLVLVYALQLVLVVPLAALSKLSGTSPVDHPATVAIVNSISIGIVLLWGLRKTRSSFSKVFPLTAVRAHLFLAAAVTTLGASIVLSEVDNLLRTILPVPAWLADAFENLLGMEENLLAALVTIAVVAPLTEELLFRGLVLRGFLLNYNARKAIFLSALLFAIFHLNPWQFSGALVAGVLFAWWFVETGSLVLCLFGHALNNALPFVFTKILGLEIPGYTDELSEAVRHQPLWFTALGFTLAILGIFALKQHFDQGEKNRDSVPGNGLGYQNEL